jgi:hypothetical protein
VRLTLLHLLAATALTLAVPAAASAQSINQRQATLDARIDAGVANRSLTVAEAAQLRGEFAGIARLETRYRRSGGRLTDTERADLDQRFDRLSARIKYDRHDADNRGGHDNQPTLNINQRQRQLDARIDAGVRGGGLTAREAANLRAEFQAIARQEAQYRASGRGLTRSERADLDQRFDRLSARIQDDRSDRDRRGRNHNGPDTNINQRQRALDAGIEAGVAGGGLTAREATDLRVESRAIARLEAQYRASGRGLTQAERAGLDQRLDRLERKIHRNRMDDERRWTNLDQRQAAFEQRLNQAVRERRVGSREAANLRNEFRGIARLEAQYRRSPPGITPNERAELNRRFDRMAASFRSNMTPNDNLFGFLLGLTR